ncbi:MAG: hypothetical protein KDD82_00845 [Planctomycetes bacterium]|nr:hypothetical protein [Planctomycetota bacterium]
MARAPEPARELASPLPTAEVSLVCAGFSRGVTLALEQRLLVGLDQDGYTQVYLGPPPHSGPWIEDLPIFSAGPGALLELRYGTEAWPLTPTPEVWLEAWVTGATPREVRIRPLTRGLPARDPVQRR